MYFHNSHVVLTNSTVSNNSAPGSGGFFGDGTDLDATNTTFASNVATTGVGGAIASTGTLTNCTFANNQAHGTNYAAFAAALFGGPWTVHNTIFDGNTDNDNSGSESCSSGTSNTGDHDLQWPMGGTDTPCVSGITFADAMLGPTRRQRGHHVDRRARRGVHGQFRPGTSCPPTDQTGRDQGQPLDARRARSAARRIDLAPSPDKGRTPWPSSSTNTRFRLYARKVKIVTLREGDRLRATLHHADDVAPRGRSRVRGVRRGEPAPRGPVPGRAATFVAPIRRS